MLIIEGSYDKLTRHKSQVKKKDNFCFMQHTVRNLGDKMVKIQINKRFSHKSNVYMYRWINQRLSKINEDFRSMN